MDPLTLAILKAAASACVKFYVTSLLSAGQIVYKEAELGYKVPKWYMNPGRSRAEFYAYGTSVKGDEFQSIDDARQLAVTQMAEHIRLSTRKIIQEKVHYDDSSIKQRRLVDLFVRGEGLEDFILVNAKPDKKQLVQVERPEEDMRAFVRLAMNTKTYLKYQEKTLGDLKNKLTHQKTEDILVEMEAEVATMQEIPGTVVPDAPEPAAGGKPPAPLPRGDGAFDALEKELDAVTKPEK